MKSKSLFVALCLLGMALFAPAQEANRQIVRKVMPVMPSIGKQINLSGTVKLDVTVAPSGKVAAVKPVGGNPILLDAAVSAVKQWIYAPGSRADTIEVAVVFNK
ncbi:MAG: energy transducer TonB [Acidobacteriaceae bacterium]